MDNGISNGLKYMNIEEKLTDKEIAYIVRGAIYNVYSALGPGLLESAYEIALTYELQKDGLNVKTQVPIDITYGTAEIPAAFRLDLLVEDSVIVELKSVERLEKVHYKQLRTYLRLTGLRTGILVNFNTENIILSMHNLENHLL